MTRQNIQQLQNIINQKYQNMLVVVAAAVAFILVVRWPGCRVLPHRLPAARHTAGPVLISLRLQMKFPSLARVDERDGSVITLCRSREYIYIQIVNLLEESLIGISPFK